MSSNGSQATELLRDAYDVADGERERRQLIAMGIKSQRINQQRINQVIRHRCDEHENGEDKDQ